MAENHDQPDQADERRAWDAVRLYRLQVYPRQTDFMIWSTADGAPRCSIGEPHEDPLRAVLSAAAEIEQRSTANE